MKCIGIAAVCVLAFTQCGGQDSRLILIGSGDTVRILSAASGNCPSGWNEGNFDDNKWTPARLPIQSSSGACMRARFDAGNQLARYRWLKIDLSARSEAHLTSAKPLGPRQGLGSINWTTQDGEAAAANNDDKHYTLDLSLFPDLLQAQKNVLALQIAASARPVAVTAELDIDDAAADPFVHAIKGPYIVRPSAGGARVVWETSSSAPSWVVVDDKQLDGGWAVHHDVAVGGLQPGSVHPVYVESAEASALPPDCAAAMVSSLMSHVPTLSNGLPDQFWQYVQRRDLCQQLAAAIRSRPSVLRAASGSGTVRLVVLGDTRADGQATGEILAAAATEAPDLFVHTGDLVSEAIEPNWQSLFDQAQPLLAQAAIAPAPGERDIAFGIDRFGQLFSVGGAGDYGHAYGIDVGAVHLAVLDSNGDLGAQATWLEGDLAQAEAAGARHLFVALHWGPYSAGPQGGNAAAVDAIVPVARRHHVDAILSGHDNIYEHGIVSGLHYFVSGGAGGTIDHPHPIGSTVLAAGVPHYLTITVSGGSARVQAKDVAGGLLDDVVLQKL